MNIDSNLVRALVRSQFPQWSGLEIRPVRPEGWDNRSFRLGDDLVVRLPSAAIYAGQVDKEQTWLPELARHLAVAIPSPVAVGAPGHGYPWKWSIYNWLEGEPLSSARDAHVVLAGEVGGFLASLQQIDATNGPAAGAHNFGRGGELDRYDREVRHALVVLEGRIDKRAIDLWSSAVGTRWGAQAVWVHGDVSPGNLLVRSGHLEAVIDFGNLGVGDPACDLAIAWTWFDGDARHALQAALALDAQTWLRGRAWGLWKALIVAAGMAQTNAIEYASPFEVIDRCLHGL